MNQRRDTTSYCKLTPLLVGLALCSVLAYVYFLNTSVVHVVLQKQTISEIQELKNDIALLEAEYITAQHTIAERMATIDGLQAERNKVFVRRDVGSGLVVNQ